MSISPELSYEHGVSTASLGARTIGAALDEAVRLHGARTAVVSIHEGVRYTYAELVTEADVLARALLAIGVERGDRVALWAPNCIDWVLTQYATARIGAILVTVNPAFRPDELAFVLQQSASRVLISARSYKTSDYIQFVDAVRDQCPDLREVFFLDSDDWRGLLAKGRGAADDALAARASELSFDDPINIQYTSGTTGAPKDATLTHHGLLNNGFFVGQRCGYTQHDRICVPVPFYHCFGMVMGNLAALTHGACVVLPAPTFDPAATLRAVQEERCTSLYGVPTMFLAELNLPDFDSYDLTSLRTGIIAGAPCPPELMRRLVSDMHIADITGAYGMTETSPISTQTLLTDSLERRTSTVGTVHPHLEVAIFEPRSTRLLPRGATGEIRVRGYSVMHGYWNDSAATLEAIDASGWMHTGDLGTMTVDGYVQVIGRVKDMIIRGGENIYPREIEDFLSAHLDVLAVHVVGVPDDLYGEQVMAWIKPRAGSGLTEAALREFCLGRLAHYKIPRYFHVMAAAEAFPMTVTGKVRKNVLRERAQELLTTTP